MVRIGVLSDTHLRHALSGAGFLDTIEKTVFRDVGMILHAGDLVDPSVLCAFYPRTVHAVRGNMDPDDVRLPLRKVFEVAGYRFGLMHGWGAPDGLAERILQEFSGDSLDCLVYGHSHMPDCRHLGRLLLFNPGSAISPRGGHRASVGILEVDGSGIRGKILPIDEHCFGPERVKRG